MAVKRIAEIIIKNPSRNLDKVFHYAIPQAKEEKVQVGMRVLVPFGYGNKKIEGFVINIIDDSNVSKLKEILEVIDEIPLLNAKMISLIEWMRENYLCTYYEAIKTMLPPGIGIKLQEWITVNDIEQEQLENKIKNSKIQKAIIQAIGENGGSIEYSNLSERLKNKNLRQSIYALKKKGLVTISNEYKTVVKEKTIRMVSLNVSEEEALEHLEQMQLRAPAQARVMEILIENESVSLADLLIFAQTSYSTINSLYKKGLITYYEYEVAREPYNIKEYQKTQPYIPTQEQKNVIELTEEKLKRGQPATILLRGVTGSGKTEVFLQIIDKVILRAKQAIVLVPEISLTPQMVERFVSRFGKKVAVLHSKLSLGERYDQWRKIKKGEVDVVVGARSAIFAPLERLGIIILDEEHENSYKSELSPKYHAREIAQKRAENEKALVLLSSATPSIESYYKAEQGKYLLAEMLNRYNNIPLPEVKIVDMRTELINGNKSIFSNLLKEQLQYNLENKQQTILFLNRRGYNTFVSCRSCGYVIMCPHCNISLTYHIANDRLTCHYCGYMTKNVKSCPKCRSSHIRHFGIGTQRVEEEIKKVFPEASVLRMDVDTTSRKSSHEKILHRFQKEHIDILIGTQMVAKGLDFPDVTLVGVLAADMSLNIDDFRSAERTFQLITQVCGRAGRGEIKGKAIIQTYQPEDETIQLAKSHDYLAFYKKEINIRKQLNYPPFCQIVSILVSGEQQQKVRDRIYELVLSFKKKLQASGHGSLCNRILGPTPAPIFKIKNKYRWRVLLKCSEDQHIKVLLKDLLDEHYGNRNNEGIQLSIDVNPINML